MERTEIIVAENLGVLINTGFNLDINKLQSELSSLQQKTKLKLDIQFDTKQLDSFKSKIDSVGKSLNNNYWQGRFTETIKDMTAIDSELVKMKQFYQEQEKVASATEKRIQKEKQVNQQLEGELANYKKYAKLQTENIGNRYKNVNGVSENLSAYNKELSEIIVKNGKLVNSNTGVETSFKNLRQGLSNIRVEARNSQNVFTDFKDNIEKFGNWLLVGGFTTGLINGIKEAITEVNSLSDAITDLRRVSEASDSQLAVLDDQAFKIADKIGGSAEGIVNSMANFSQLGYEYNEAMNLAQDASKYATAGFISNEEATQSLISTYQVFGNTFDEVMGKMVDSKSIIDAFNSVGKFIA